MFLGLNHNQKVGMELGLPCRLTRFGVAHNLSTGQVPDFITAKVRPESYANNAQLCRGPLEPCDYHEIKLDDSHKFGFVTGFVFSVITVFIFSNISIMSMVMSLFSSWLQAIQLFMQITRLEKLVNKISFTELIKATDNSSIDNVIGREKIGTMYKATLPKWLVSCKENEKFLVEKYMSNGNLHDWSHPAEGDN
ncbi:hypothetical protein FEM48_Zijuj05G0181600 [Ziziphus jujuba var. spinosa]|uniref:Uncharacterized protein n=1 Tax=Ziziphus jujuba var. spinosa TaxID=714518 RepID=A0A978VGC5_ZIZJJ|nr:hypothetical protein FEM48_Zijuj05G0181600 [Ziziphus jujuba var. spinosa]